MCGINGIVDLNNILSSIQIQNILEKFNRSLFHRGPNGNGFEIYKNIGLGHTRLSIIDLSQNGKQPMYDKNKDVLISYNGEIYNFLDLKKKYLNEFKFNSQTDTEVILNLYKKIGIEKLIEEINGMYAFSILDKKKNKLILSRDKIGKKPLYYYYGVDFIIWSSELKTFKKSPIYNKIEINEEAIRNYFDVGYIPSPLTIFKNINKLLPGETIEIDLQKKTKKNFFFEKKKDSFNLENFDFNSFEQILEDAVKIRTISDVPYGVFLSSGVDSSLVASILSKTKTSKINSFSIGIENSNLDESKNSEKIAKSLGLTHNELIINENDLINIIPKMVDTYGEPFADPSQIPTYILSEFCKKKITVALSGDGGDEIFGGYNRYIYYKKYKYLIKTLFLLNKFSLLNNIFFKKFINFKSNIFITKESAYKLKSLHKMNNLSDFYLRMVQQNHEIEKIFKYKINYNKYFLKGPENENDLKSMQIKDINNYLPDDILTKVDRASMAHSLEVRCPLLDKRLHKYVGLSDENKISNNNSKILLKKILSKYLDINLISKNKMGFAIPIHNWLANQMYTKANEIFNSDLLKNDDYLDQQHILKIWEMNLRGDKNYAFLLWSIIIYLNWKDSWKKSA